MTLPSIRNRPAAHTACTQGCRCWWHPRQPRMY